MEMSAHGGGGGGIHVTASRPPAQIEIKMDDLNETVSRLQNQVEQLVKMVDPILRPDYTEKGEKPSMPQDVASQSRLADSIENVSMRIRKITEVVVQTIDRVEV